MVISRFGTMFFSDPAAAFTNIAAALRPGGRLCLATWQPLAANEWLTTPGAALLHRAEMPASVHGRAGDVRPVRPRPSSPPRSRAAGFTDIGLEAREVALDLGETVDDAVDYLADSGPGRALLEAIPEGPDRDAALADLRAVTGRATRTDSGVRLGRRDLDRHRAPTR